MKFDSEYVSHNMIVHNMASLAISTMALFTTDVRGGTSGTLRDVPVFVQFHEKFVQLMKMTENV